MQKRATIGGLLLVALGVILGATVFRTDIARATGLASGPTVTVVNTPAQAVPVREQNLDGGNIKVHEEGTANVRVVDSQEPFQQALNVSLADGEFGDDAFFTVPAGKRLVIQYVAVRAFVPPNEGVSVGYRVGNALGTTAGVPIVSGGLQRTSAGDTVPWAGGGPVLAFANAGQNVSVSLDRESSLTPSEAGGSASMTAIVTGYLVPSS